MSVPGGRHRELQRAAGRLRMPSSQRAMDRLTAVPLTRGHDPDIRNDIGHRDAGPGPHCGDRRHGQDRPPGGRTPRSRPATQCGSARVRDDPRSTGRTPPDGRGCSRVPMPSTWPTTRIWRSPARPRRSVPWRGARRGPASVGWCCCPGAASRARRPPSGSSRRRAWSGRWYGRASSHRTSRRGSWSTRCGPGYWRCPQARWGNRSWTPMTWPTRQSRRSPHRSRRPGLRAHRAETAHLRRGGGRAVRRRGT